MNWLSRGASGHGAAGSLRPGLAAVALGAVIAVTAGACSGPPPPSARDRNWRQDIAYLARELPAVRAGGLGTVLPATWRASAARLEAAVPRLSDGQIITGLAQLVAQLHDDETRVQFPSGPFLTLDAQRVGDGLYLLAVPAADRTLLSDSETGALDDLALLHSLGLAVSTASAMLTVRTRAGTQETVRLAAAHSDFVIWPYLFIDQAPDLAHVPLPLYQQNATRPYWLRILPAQSAAQDRRPGHRPGRPVHRLVGHRGRGFPEAGRGGADGPAARRSPRQLGQRADLPATPFRSGHPVHDGHSQRDRSPVGDPGRRDQADAGPAPGRR